MEFTENSHHIAPTVTDADCQICHAEVDGDSNHQDASVDLLDPDQNGTTYSVTWLDGNRASLTASDIITLTTFCQNCHDSDGAARLLDPDDPFGDGVSVSAVGTHSNQDFSGLETGFYAGCIQCHNSHGSSNLALIDSNIVITPSVIEGPVVFTAYTGINSYDEDGGDSDDTDDICTTCHTHVNNAGYPMDSHPGGDHTAAGGSDNRGTDCRTCHPHEPDSDPTTRNGHMPADANALELYGLLAQGGLWPIAGLGIVLVAVAIRPRKHRKI